MIGYDQEQKKPDTVVFGCASLPLTGTRAMQPPMSAGASMLNQGKERSLGKVNHLHKNANLDS
jgi:hypothetical protein